MNTQCDAPGTLVLKTRRLLNNRKEAVSKVAKDTGIPLDWLRKFSGGQIPNPSVNRVQFLFEKLSGKSLPLSK